MCSDFSILWYLAFTYNMNNVKYLVLILLVLQTSLTVLTLRYIRTSANSTAQYLSSTVVLLVELVKATSCILILLLQTSKFFM